MTNSPQKRDNRYYMDRLRIEHPAVHADYMAGRFRNASEAFAVAGLRRPPSALSALQSAWAKATPAERDAFKAMIGCVAPAVTLPQIAPSGTASAPMVRPASAPVVRSASAPVVRSVVTKGRQRLSQALATDVCAIMHRRGLKSGNVMLEIGRKPLNASLGRALYRDTTVTKDMVVALEAWVARHTVP
jgi:hypothetical protein